MNFSEKKILNIIDQGENVYVEFKESKIHADTLAKEIISFANYNGGTLLLGVSDNGRIKGVHEEKNYEEWIANIVRNNVIPSIQVDCYQMNVNGKRLIIVNIPKGKDKPYQSINGKYYIRVGSTNRIATQQELLRLFQASGVFHYDLNSVPCTSIKDLNFTKLDQYFQRYSLSFSQENDKQKQILLQNVDILSEFGEVTIGGLLIFGINPSKYLFQSGISFACFKGVNINQELLNNQKIEGTLDYLIDTGVAVIKNHVMVPSIIDKNKRKDKKFIYSDAVYKELITNAVVHRNYSISGSKIRIFLFDDRLEVISPGRLPNTVSIKKLPFGVSFAVNPVIVKFMENFRYIDQLGRGLPMVYNEAVSNGKKVIFEEFGEEFKVVLEL